MCFSNVFTLNPGFNPIMKREREILAIKHVSSKRHPSARYGFKSTLLVRYKINVHTLRGQERAKSRTFGFFSTHARARVSLWFNHPVWIAFEITAVRKYNSLFHSQLRKLHRCCTAQLRNYLVLYSVITYTLRRVVLFFFFFFFSVLFNLFSAGERYSSQFS